MNDMKSIDTQSGIYGFKKENQKENTIALNNWKW